MKKEHEKSGRKMTELRANGLKKAYDEDNKEAADHQSAANQSTAKGVRHEHPCHLLL